MIPTSSILLVSDIGKRVGSLLTFYGWAERSGFPVKELGAYTAWRERMMQRPTVKKSVEDEQKVSA